MKEPIKYLQLASHFEAAAEGSLDKHARKHLHELAQSYFILAKSTSVLQRSGQVLRQLKSGSRSK